MGGEIESWVETKRFQKGTLRAEIPEVVSATGVWQGFYGIVQLRAGWLALSLGGQQPEENFLQRSLFLTAASYPEKILVSEGSG